MKLSHVYESSAPVSVFRPSWFRRFMSGCLFSHDYPLWRRLTPTRMVGECPRCGEQSLFFHALDVVATNDTLRTR